VEAAARTPDHFGQRVLPGHFFGTASYSAAPHHMVGQLAHRSMTQ
jgi:hypothetical protein